MLLTTNYNLNKPAYIDPADISPLNVNFDTIDAQLFAKVNKSDIKTSMAACENVTTAPPAASLLFTLNTSVSNIISGTTKIGNADKLDGYDSAAFLFLTGGTMSGNLTVPNITLTTNLTNGTNTVTVANIASAYTHSTSSHAPTDAPSNATFTGHTGNTTVHITSAERTAWNAKSTLALGTTSTTAYRGDYGNTAYAHSQASHAPTDAPSNATFTGHTGDTTVHITAAERTTWNAKSTLALGTTSTTAYRGDYGNTAYTHSQAAHAPTNAEANQTLTSGNGMAAWTATSGNLTITLGTPSTITEATTNSVTATSHTHALTIHTHANKAYIDKFSEVGGKLNYDGRPLEGSAERVATTHWVIDEDPATGAIRFIYA